MAELDGKVVLIAGANGDLGTAVTKAFLDAGAKVAGAARKITDSDFPNPSFRGFSADVSKEEDTAALVSKVIAEFGRIDVLAHLVGGWAPGSADTTDLATLDKMLNVNLRTAFLTIRESLKQMKKQGSGRILAVGSKLAVEPAAGSLPYGIAKAAIDMSRDPNISASSLGAFISALLVLLIGLLADGIALRLGRMHQNVTGVPLADELGSAESHSSAVGVGH